MKSMQQLARSCQSSLLSRLPGWHRHRSYGIYRRTDDFVQWLLLQKSSFDVHVRPGFAIQALAQQESAETITLGDIARTQQGTELWIAPDFWADQQSFLIDMILAQVKPPVTTPLTARVVRDYLETLQNNHVVLPVARGIASVIIGEIESGRYDFQQAQIWYQRIAAPWAREEEQRIHTWLACSDATLLSKLREDAQVGATLLKLK